MLTRGLKTSCGAVGHSQMQVCELSSSVRNVVALLIKVQVMSSGRKKPEKTLSFLAVSCRSAGKLKQTMPSD